MMFKSYDAQITKVLSSKTSGVNWKNTLKTHKRMIEIIQHERLMHLLVTIFVGTILSLTSLATVITGEAYLLFLDIPLIILFTGYLIHYRCLENTTQSWYKLEEKIEKNLK